VHEDVELRELSRDVLLEACELDTCGHTELADEPSERFLVGLLSEERCADDARTLVAAREGVRERAIRPSIPTRKGPSCAEPWSGRRSTGS
jgi:hypothetical protein